MGRFAVEIEVVNNRDVALALGGHLEPAKIRRMKIQGTVDPGATLLVLPLALVKALGLPIKEQKIKVRHAGGRKSLRAAAEEARVNLQGREGTFTAIVEPKRETALIGAVVLETLDFLIDPRKEWLVPRDPDYVVSEIE